MRLKSVSMLIMYFVLTLVVPNSSFASDMDLIDMDTTPENMFSRFLNKTDYMELKNGEIYVLDSNKAELEMLKGAIEELFSLRCSDVVGHSGIFKLEVASCLPPKVSKRLGWKTTEVPGPNCYSYALFSLGIIDPLHRVMSDHHELFFKEDSQFCRLKNFNERAPGDIIYTGGHGFMYLTDKFALAAKGAGRVFEITTNAENLALAGGGTIKDYPFYRCQTPNVSIPSELLPTMQAIKKFNGDLEDYLFVDGLDPKNLKIFMNKINTLEQSITVEKAKALLKNAANPLVRAELYGLIGMYYTVSKVSHKLETVGSETEDKVSAEMYRPAHLSYLKVLDRIADLKHAIIFDTYTLSVVYKFCETDREVIPNLCGFHDLYNKGEIDRFGAAQ